MSTWEDLDGTSLDEDDEKANISLMADTTFEESESDHEDEVNFDDSESFNGLLSNSSIPSKAYKILQKDF